MAEKLSSVQDHVEKNVLPDRDTRCSSYRTYLKQIRLEFF